jgi:hypothetical protein
MAKRGVGGTFETPRRLSNNTTANVITETYGH